MPTTYTIDKTRLAAYRRKAAIFSVALYGGLGLIALLVVNGGDFSPTGLIGVAGVVMVLALVVGLITWSSLRTLNRRTASIRFVVDNETITGEDADTPPMTLRRADLTVANEYPGRGLLLRTADPQVRLYISEMVEGFPALRAALTTNLSVVRHEPSGARNIRIIMAALIPILLLTALGLATSRPLIITLGVVTAGGALGLNLYAQRNPSFPRWLKLTALLLIPLVVLVVFQRLSAIE